MSSRASWNVDGVTPSSGTRAVPTASTEGFDLGGALAYVIVVYADAGKVLTGAGTMEAYRWIQDINDWARDPDLDFAITNPNVTWANTRARCASDFEVGVPAGRHVWRANGVAVDSGNLNVGCLAFAS